VAEAEIVAVEVARRVVAEVIRAVVERLRDLDTVRAMEIVKLVRVADDEIDDAAVRARSRLTQKNLDVAEVHARERRRIALRERDPEAELLRVELDRRGNVADRQAGVMLFAIDVHARTSARDFLID